MSRYAEDGRYGRPLLFYLDQAAKITEMETTAQKTKRIIADALGADLHLLTYDTHLKRDLGADSLDVLEVITILGDEFHVSVDEERIERMTRVGDFIKYFEEKKSDPPYAQTRTAA